MGHCARWAIIAAAGALFGCETTTETSDGRRMPPPPREGMVTPDEAPINAMALVLGPKPLDTDGNLLPDTIQIEAYLFSRPFPNPMHRDGTFEFAIYRSGGAGRTGEKPLRVWTISPERLAGMRGKSLVGPSFSIGISLLEDGATDRIGEQSVDLMAHFTEVGSTERVPSMGVRSVSLSSPAVGRGQ
jgi:hypothetical protein